MQVTSLHHHYTQWPPSTIIPLYHKVPRGVSHAGDLRPLKAVGRKEESGPMVKRVLVKIFFWQEQGEGGLIRTWTMWAADLHKYFTKAVSRLQIVLHGDSVVSTSSRSYFYAHDVIVFILRLVLMYALYQLWLQNLLADWMRLHIKI